MGTQLENIGAAPPEQLVLHCTYKVLEGSFKVKHKKFVHFVAKFCVVKKLLTSILAA